MTVKHKQETSNPDVSAWIDEDCHGEGWHIMVCNNGFQASGAAMYSHEAIVAARDALDALLAELEKGE